MKLVLVSGHPIQTDEVLASRYAGAVRGVYATRQEAKGAYDTWAFADKAVVVIPEDADTYGDVRNLMQLAASAGVSARIDHDQELLAEAETFELLVNDGYLSHAPTA